MKTQSKTSKPAVGKKTLGNKMIYLLWMSILVGTVTTILVFFLASKGVFGEMPNVNDLESPDIYVASEIISSDGVILDKYEKEKRIPVEYKDLPPNLVNALKAKEDVRFNDHSGVDFKRTASAIAHLGTRGGASTITQQLAKLLFSGQPSNNMGRIIQKIKENIIAVRLEKLYTKDEILTMYLNKFNFLNGANGVEMASRVYFNKHVNQLNLSESATLIAMLQLPYGYNPKSNPKNAIKGRDGVLNQMVKYNYLPQSEYDKLAGTPIAVDFTPVRNSNETFSAYYKYSLRKEIEGYLTDYEKKHNKKYDLFKDGLKIHVTIDSRMQKYAEESMREWLMGSIQPIFNRSVRGYKRYPYNTPMSNATYDTLMNRSIRKSDRYKYLKNAGKSWAEILENFNTPTRLEIFSWKKGIEDTLMKPIDSIKYHKTIAQSGFMAMEPHSGQIKAWVGGVDWNFFKYDHVKQGRRQVGSTFKPFVYATAITDLGYTPCYEVSSATYRKGSYMVPGGGGMLTIRDALAHSKNTVALRLIDATGVDRVINMCREMGVTSPLERNNTIALGSGDITIYEMLGAYCTFANYGTYTKPNLIWRIEDNKGKVIKEIIPETRDVMNELYAYTMLDIMQGVTKYGTAKAMRSMGITGQVAGKTGTTNGNSDCWFIGITPNLAAGCWVGFQERASRNFADGARVAMPIWVKFMKKVFADKELGYLQSDKFDEPDEVKANGGFNCDILTGLIGDEGKSLYTAEQVFEGLPVEESEVPKVSSRPSDKGVNSKLLEEDSLKDEFNE